VQNYKKSQETLTFCCKYSFVPNENIDRHISIKARLLGWSQNKFCRYCPDKAVSFERLTHRGTSPSW